MARAIAHLNRKGGERGGGGGAGEEEEQQQQQQQRGRNRWRRGRSSRKGRRPAPPPPPPLLLPFPVHRLDMATSGVVVMGKTSAAAAALQAQFRGRTAKKTYLALVAGGGGRASGSGGSVDVAIGRHPELKVGRRAVVVDRGRRERGARGSGGETNSDDETETKTTTATSDAQPALTRFAVLARCDGAAAERAMRRRTEEARLLLPPPFSSLYSLGELARAAGTLRSLRDGAALLACAPGRGGRTRSGSTPLSAGTRSWGTTFTAPCRWWTERSWPAGCCFTRGAGAACTLGVFFDGRRRRERRGEQEECCASLPRCPPSSEDHGGPGDGVEL